jgi:hypothetical protein
MNTLLKKDVSFRWDDKAIKSFKNINNAISKAPVLIIYGYSKDFIILWFASQYTIVGVLMQKDDDDYEHPVAFMIPLTPIGTN